MNVTEANALNVVLRYLGLRTEHERNVDDQDLYDAAREAAVLLTERANETLGASLRGDDVEDAWDRLDLGPWDDEPVGYAHQAGGPDA